MQKQSEKDCCVWAMPRAGVAKMIGDEVSYPVFVRYNFYREGLEW